MDRRSACGIVIALAMSAALVASPVASGANDPVATGTFKLKLARAFKKQLKRNGVKMKPRSPKFKSGSLDPITGAGSLKLTKIKFKKGGKKLVYRKVTARLGANGAKGIIKGSKGRLFRLKRGTVTRNGFGATVSGIKAKFLKRAAKKINRKLDLSSLHGGRAGKASFDEQPKTVEVLGGTAQVDVPASYLPPTGPDSGSSLAGKNPSHCIDPALGVTAITPGTKTSFAPPFTDPPGIAARFAFPVTGGTVSPAGNDGVIQLSGGVMTATGEVGASPFEPLIPDDCTDNLPGEGTSNSFLNTTNLAPNLGLLNIQSNVFIGGLSPGCNGVGLACGPAVSPGDKGIAIGQTIDPAGQIVSADPTAKTVAISGGTIKINSTSALTLNGVFPNASGDPTKNFADGDKFGVSTLTVNTR